jgi:hypothetical protein
VAQCLGNNKCYAIKLFTHEFKSRPLGVQVGSTPPGSPTAVSGVMFLKPVSNNNKQKAREEQVIKEGDQVSGRTSVASVLNLYPH